MLDILDMIEKDKLFYFLTGLLWEAPMELQRRIVYSLTKVVTTIECLRDYDINFLNLKSHGGGSYNANVD